MKTKSIFGERLGATCNRCIKEMPSLGAKCTQKQALMMLILTFGFATLVKLWK